MSNYYPHGFDLIGAVSRRNREKRGEVLGYFDIQSWQKQMNSLKQVPVSIANSLLKGGQAIINWAITTATTLNLPMPTPRANVRAHLAWHENELKKYTDLGSIYPSGDDLKKWVMQAFIEANAVQNDAEYLNSAWSDMWSEIAERIKALPATVAETVTSAASTTVSTLKWVGIGLAAIAVLAGAVMVRNAFKK